MILKHIYLYLNTVEYTKGDLNSDFQFRTRSLCNFLERRLKGKKFKADGFSKICVQGRENPDVDCRIVSENALVAEVYFDRSRYESLHEVEYYDFLINMLEKGLRKCRIYHAIPLEVLLDGINDFRAGGYKNQWVFKAKTFKTHGLKATLICDLTMTEFVLTMTVARDGQIVFEKPILRTKPDELIFEHQFKDIKETDDTLIVSNKFGRTLYEVKVPELAGA